MCRGKHGRHEGQAGTVGKPEKPAGVAKIVPQANDCRVCAAPSSIEGLALSLGRARFCSPSSIEGLEDEQDD